ncbi:MAG: hypothetical protein IMZ53_11730 [Thermoplasmata archaeon]|nr:hypothetical protein [Thermoplasmata archaeon]
MDHTYNGSHGYQDRSYLIPGLREAFYEKRRRASYYVNIFKPIVDAMITPVFTATIDRKSDNSDAILMFLDNCDNAGTDMTVAIKNAITTARINSISFVVVENFDAKTITDDEAANIQNRAFPYIYEKTAQEVHKWGCNRQGGLKSITFCDRIEAIKEKDTTKQRHFYREWDSMNWREYYIDDPVNGKESIEVESGDGIHGLGVIPVIPVLNFARSSNLKALPTPDLYNLAYLCFALFQKESKVVTGEDYQTFALLALSNWGRSALNAGATNFIDCGPDSKWPPLYVAPPQDGLRTVVSNCERLKEEIKNEAKQSGVIGIKEAKSGLAKEWDFRAEETVLRDTAQAAMELEMKIIAIVEKYMKTSFGYTVRYETNYSPNADAIRSDRMMAIIDKVMSGPLNEAAQKEIVKIEWKSDPDEVEEIIAEMETDQDEKDAIGAMRKEEILAAEAKAKADAEQGMSEEEKTAMMEGK